MCYKQKKLSQHFILTVNIFSNELILLNPLLIQHVLFKLPQSLKGSL